MSVSRTSSPDLVPVNTDDRAVSPLILDGNDALVEAIQQAALEVIHSPIFSAQAPPTGLLEELDLDPLNIGGEPLHHMGEWVLHFDIENGAPHGQNNGIIFNHLMTSSTRPNQAFGA